MFAQVVPAKRGLVSLPFFDYAIPSDLKDKLRIGQLVYIPLRNREEIGVVKSFSETPTSPAKNIKEISSIFFDKPVLSAKELSFLEEISGLYHTSIGFLVKSSLPPLQKRKLSKVEESASAESAPAGQFSKPKLYVYQNETEKMNYFRDQIPSNGQTLILVPEITDIDMILNLLSEKQRAVAALVSSDLSEKEYFKTWMEIWKGEKQIIIGTRQALFLSFSDLRTIFIDDEAASSHKSWDSAPRINARDAALIAAKHHGAALHITCHQPSVETYFFAESGVYEHNRPYSQMDKQPVLVNMLAESRSGNFGPISNVLFNAINDSTGSVFLFCHRKGTASYVSCRDCGTVSKCKNCDRPLTYHESRSEMVCHHCSYRENMNEACKACGGVNLTKFGVGAEAVAKEIKRLFPNDTRGVITIEESKETLCSLDQNTNQIIVGTQLAYSHIPWKNIALMAVIDADTPLFVPEYKITENVWQMIFGSAYRLPEGARFVIQTSHPEHLIFSSLHEPKNYYDTELKTRKVFSYPPYKFILKLFYGSPDRPSGQRETSKMNFALEHLTKSIADIKITPPIEMFPPFKKGKYWQAIIIKLPFKSYKNLSRAILRICPESWKVDPNPNTLLSL